MQDIYSLVVLFLSTFAGLIARATYPWLQKQKENEDMLKALNLIPQDQLTPEQKQFILNASQPLNFRRFYLYTAIYGLIGSAATAMGSFLILMNQLPKELPFSAVLAFIPVTFLAGWGGGSVSNQLLSSKSSGSDLVKKSVFAGIASKINKGS